MDQSEYYADLTAKTLLFDFAKRNGLSDYDIYTIWNSKEFNELNNKAWSLIEKCIQGSLPHGNYVTEVINNKQVINVFVDRDSILNEVISKRVKELNMKEQYHDKTIRITKMK